MKMFLTDRESGSDREVNWVELRAVLNTLKCDPDGGDVEMIVLWHVDGSGNMYFDIESYSTF